jgi:hypothetical protein
MYDDPQYAGYSIGKWVDEDGDGRYDTMVAETRGLKNPRTYDATGIPFHEDGHTIIKERIYLDKKDLNTLYDEITVFDDALTRPWTALKYYHRVAAKGPIWWREDICAENNVHVMIANEDFYLSASWRGPMPLDGSNREPPGYPLTHWPFRSGYFVSSLTPTLSPAVHSAMPSMLHCCTSDLKRRLLIVKPSP